MKDSQHYDDNNSEQDEEQSHESGEPSAGDNRWDIEEFNQMDFVCTFLDNEEDTLPEIFDTKKIQKQKQDNCTLCDKLFSMIFVGQNNSKRHHCRKCGISVCQLCSASPKRRLSKLDKKKYRVCDQCDTLMSNINFESMYVNCLSQQEQTLQEVKKNILKRDLQLKQLNTQLDKYKKTLETKLKEIAEKENTKRQILSDKEEFLSSKTKEYEDLKKKLHDLESEIELKDQEIEKMRNLKDKMRDEKKKIEEQRLKKENELQEQNQRLHQVIEEEYANSFKDNQVEEVEDVDDRFDWKGEDTSYEESYSIKEKVLQKDAADVKYD